MNDNNNNNNNGHGVSIYEAAYQYCCNDETNRFLNETIQRFEPENTIADLVDKFNIDSSCNTSANIDVDSKSFYTITTTHPCQLATASDSSNTVTKTTNTIDIIEQWDGSDFNSTMTTTTATTAIWPRGWSRPCLIRDCYRLQQCFEVPRTLWILPSPPPSQPPHSNDITMKHACQNSNTVVDDSRNKSRIHREWFLEICGDTTLVPVYWNHRPTTTISDSSKRDVLDTDGRVMECPMQHMTIQQYVMDSGLHDDDQFIIIDDNRIPYLKDWHFQFWYEQHHNRGFHYSLPDYLPYDLLNGFLLRFDPSAKSLTSVSSSQTISDRNHNHNDHKCGSEQRYNDYRFVYWGPRNSSTDIHTDVLLSLSWSYNVHGTKLWTFYIPSTTTTIDSNNNDHLNDTVISIEQRTGDLMIVPSGMRHSVTNQEETLSINHNWITTDILSLVWQCIKTELIAVDQELLSWDNTWTVQCYDARESMLRGCVGLNVSLYFFMILTRGLDLLKKAVVIRNTDRHYNLKEIYVDLIHIRNAIQEIYEDPIIGVKDRLTATLQNDTTSDQAIQMGSNLVKAITLVVVN